MGRRSMRAFWGELESLEKQAETHKLGAMYHGSPRKLGILKPRDEHGDPRVVKQRRWSEKDDRGDLELERGACASGYGAASS